MRALFIILLLAGCATPVTILRNDETGKIITCGGGTFGSVSGGMIGYHIEKSQDADCVIESIKQGYKPVERGELK